MSIAFRIRAVVFSSASLLFLAGCGPSKEQIAHVQSEQEATKKVLVNGEVFIRAKDASVHPLSLVEVAVYQPQAIATHNASVEAEKEKIQAPILVQLAKLQAGEKIAIQALETRRGVLQAMVEGNKFHRQMTRDGSLSDEFIQITKTQIQKVKDAEARDNRIKAVIAQTLDDLEKWPASSDYFRQLPPALITTITDSAGKFALELAPDQEVVVVAKSDRHVADEIEHYYWMIRFLPSRVANAKIILANQNIGSSGAADSVISTKKEQPFDAPAFIPAESKPD